MDKNSENNNNTPNHVPKWAKNIGLFLLVFVIISLIGILPEIGFFRLYFGGKINQMAFERRPSSILWEEPIKIPGRFNEISNNYDAVISSDGSFVIFSRLFSENNYDLFISRKVEGKWSSPEPISNINTASNELNPVISEDGKLLFFSSDRPNGKGLYDIWCSILTEDSNWSNPYHLAGDINTQYNEVFPEISPLKDALFFSSDRLKSHKEKSSELKPDKENRNFDIYRSIRISENFQIVSSGPPAFGFVENIEELNSPANEGKIAVSEDGGLVYFSSDRPGGYGGYDIYVSALRNGKYIEPVNFKSPINTQYDEISPFMRMGTFKILFCSNKNSRSFKDFHIYESRSYQVFSTLNKEVILLILLILILLVSIFLLMKYLFSNTNLSLLAKCFLVSIIIHLILLLIFSALYLREHIIQDYSDEGELSINISNLAKESIAASLREGIASLPKQTSQPVTTRNENISNVAQLNQEASAASEPKEFLFGENTSSTPESIASVEQMNEDSSPSSNEGSLSLSDLFQTNNVIFTMEMPKRVSGRSEKQNFEGDGVLSGIGSGVSGEGKTSGNRVLEQISASSGSLDGTTSSPIGSLNTSAIKGDKVSQGTAQDEQNSGEIKGLTSSMIGKPGSYSGADDESDDNTESGSLGDLIASTPGDQGKDKKSASPAIGLMPLLGKDNGSSRVPVMQTPNIGFLTSQSGKTERVLNFPLQYRTDNTQHMGLKTDIIFAPRPDIPLSTYVGTYFFTRKFALLSLSNAIYRSTDQFSLPANTEMEISDKFTLKEQDAK